MNDKAKKVLSYVACAIGGACLGIALLGGLSYCSTSSAREKTDTINTIDRVRHNEAITTDGGYSGYGFRVLNWYGVWNEGTVHRRIYTVNRSTYAVQQQSFGENTSITSRADWINYLNSSYTDATPTGNQTLNFLAMYGRVAFSSSQVVNVWYFSFVPTSGSTNYLKTTPFVFTNPPSGEVLFQYIDRWDTLGLNQTNAYIQPTAKNPFFSYSASVRINEDPYFQDVISYYQEKGYQDGYSDGETAGNSTGYSSGYNDGYEVGSSAGYESGYDQGFQEGYMNTYYAFTSLIVNRNAIWSMADIPWHSYNDIYIQPGHLSDYPFLDPAILQTNTYVNWAYLALFRDTATLIPYWIYAQRYTTSQNNGYVNFVIRISPADQTSTENAGNIGSYSGGVSLSETSIFQTENVTEWTAQNRCQLIAFGSEDPRDIYRDWFDNGYILPRGIAVDENAYEQGYKQGQLDAQRNTSMNNVFALFTPAFGAVASFFDMKIFGFLPLYWFLIAPLFIALISLIMRMVKH